MDVVTGATGHLGNVLTRALLARGRRVRVVTRSGGEALAGLDVEICRGDLGDTGTLERAFRGAHHVYHAAGLVSFGTGGRAALYEANYRGTLRVLEACRSSGASRLVYVSSVEALDLRSPVVTESEGFVPRGTVLYYGMTKALAARAVLESAHAGLEAVVICPTGFIGPFDYRLGAMGRLVVDYAHHRLPVAVEGGFDFVDVRDVAEGAILAAQRGRSGQCYILSGRYATVREILDGLKSLTGAGGPRLWIPRRLALAAAAAAELWYGASGRPPRFTRASVRLLSLNVRVSCDKARRDLGYAPRELEVTLRDTVAWMRSAGLIPAAAIRDSRRRRPTRGGG